RNRADGTRRAPRRRQAGRAVDRRRPGGWPGGVPPPQAKRLRASRRGRRRSAEAHMKIALISPKGPLYCHRGGIFRKSLRYQPLTLTTLAALIPPELEAHVKLYDEGIEDVPAQLDADIVGMTVITGTSKRAY